MNRGIYIASRASIPERPARWRRMRDEQSVPFISTWIDEDGPGQSDMSELWPRIVGEVLGCASVILYVEPMDLPLKGAFIEVGIAMGAGIPIMVVAPEVSDKTIGSWVSHPLVTRCETVREAVEMVLP